MKMRFRMSAVFIVLLLCGLAGCGSQEPVSDADKSVFLRATELASYGLKYENAERYETFSKTRQFDGAYQLTYEFETPEGERPLYIYTSVSVARNVSDAAVAEGAEKIGMLIGLRSAGVEEKDVSLEPGKERRRLKLLLKGGKPLGNLFTARNGRKTYILVVAGLYFDDAQAWEKLVEPKLRQLAGYSPA